MAKTTGLVYLLPAIQTYEWGKVGDTSLVAHCAQSCYNQLIHRCDEHTLKHFSKKMDLSFVIDPQKPYAELWMGMHPKGTSHIVFDSSESLETPHKPQSLLSLPQYLQRYYEQSPELPYLFKILSVAKPLSIQLHPDAAKSKALNLSHPHLYTNPNAKPEMAIAINYLELLCGFRPLPEIAYYVMKTPELQQALQLSHEVVLELHSLAIGFTGENIEMQRTEHHPEILKTVVSSLLRAPDSIVQAALVQLIARIDSMTFTAESTLPGQCVVNVYKLVKRLHTPFPGDVGVLFAFLLNFVRLEDKESIFISANKLHAYIEGDCVECMVNSDNVVRCGLTPKFKDVELLIDILNYEESGLTVERILPQTIGETSCAVQLYQPHTHPLQPFQVYKIVGPEEGKLVNYCFSSNCHAIGIVLHSNSDVKISVGSVTHVAATGDIVMLDPSASVTFERLAVKNAPTSPALNDFLMYIATSSSDYNLSH